MFPAASRGLLEWSAIAWNPRPMPMRRAGATREVHIGEVLDAVKAVLADLERRIERFEGRT